MVYSAVGPCSSTTEKNNLRSFRYGTAGRPQYHRAVPTQQLWYTVLHTEVHLCIPALLCTICDCEWYHCYYKTSQQVSKDCSRPCYTFLQFSLRKRFKNVFLVYWLMFFGRNWFNNTFCGLLNASRTIHFCCVSRIDEKFAENRELINQDIIVRIGVRDYTTHQFYAPQKYKINYSKFYLT